MMIFIEIKLQNFGTFLDNTLLKKPIFYKFFCVFFDFTSRLTNFLLFDRFFYPFFIFVVAFWTHHYFGSIRAFIFNVKIAGLHKVFDVFFSMPLGFQLGLLFLFFFYQVIFLNTILAYSKKIQLFMKNKYNESVMKELHYNSGVSTFAKSVWPVAAATCIFCVGDYMEKLKVDSVVTAWEKVSKAAIDRGQVPSECPVKITVHTTSVRLPDTVNFKIDK